MPPWGQGGDPVLEALRRRFQSRVQSQAREGRDSTREYDEVSWPPRCQTSGRGLVNLRRRQIPPEQGTKNLKPPGVGAAPRAAGRNSTL